MTESDIRLDRIERLTEANAQAIAQLAIDRAATNIEMRANTAMLTQTLKETHEEMRTGFEEMRTEMRAGFEELRIALKEMAEAKKEMMESQSMLLRTLDRLAKLWGQSPN